MDGGQRRKGSRSSLGDRGRRRILWGIAIFLAAQVGTSLLIDHWALKEFDGIYGTKAKRVLQRIDHAPRDAAVVLAFGSSRTMCGLDASKLERALEESTGRPVVAFNFGNLGNAALAQRIMLERLLSEGCRPDLALFEITPAFLTGNAQSKRAARSGLNYLRIRAAEMPLVCYYGLGPLVQADFCRYWLAPWYYHRNRILGMTVPWLANRSVSEGEEFDEWGFQRHHKKLETGEKQAEWNAVAMGTIGNPYYSDFRVGGPSESALRDTLAVCRERGIRTGLVVVPEGAAFRKLYDARWREVEAFLSQIEREYGSTVVVARDWVGETGFWDGHHMVREGAETFTNRFCREAAPRLAAGLIEAVAIRDGMRR